MTMLAAALLIAGTFFLTVAALGVVRLPDAYQRMHAGTKAGTLGATLVLLGAIGGEGDASRPLTVILTIVFLLVTLPVAAQLLGRAAYMSGAPMLGIRGPDPLEGVIDREAAPLEERVRQDAAMADPSPGGGEGR